MSAVPGVVEFSKPPAAVLVVPPPAASRMVAEPPMLVLLAVGGVAPPDPAAVRELPKTEPVLAGRAPVGGVPDRPPPASPIDQRRPFAPV